MTINIDLNKIRNNPNIRKSPIKATIAYIILIVIMISNFRFITDESYMSTRKLIISILLSIIVYFTISIHSPRSGIVAKTSTILLYLNTMMLPFMAFILLESHNIPNFEKELHQVIYYDEGNICVTDEYNSINWGNKEVTVELKVWNDSEDKQYKVSANAIMHSENESTGEEKEVELQPLEDQEITLTIYPQNKKQGYGRLDTIEVLLNISKYNNETSQYETVDKYSHTINLRNDK